MNQSVCACVCAKLWHCVEALCLQDFWLRESAYLCTPLHRTMSTYGKLTGIRQGTHPCLWYFTAEVHSGQIWREPCLFVAIH